MANRVGGFVVGAQVLALDALTWQVRRGTVISKEIQGAHLVRLLDGHEWYFAPPYLRLVTDAPQMALL